MVSTTHKFFNKGSKNEVEDILNDIEEREEEGEEETAAAKPPKKQKVCCITAIPI